MMQGILPPAAGPYAFGFLLSGFMSLLVSGVATALSKGVDGHFPLAWMTAWLPSWAIAFPIVLVVAPVVRRIVAYLVASPTLAKV
jgi:hypothetical protein